MRELGLEEFVGVLDKGLEIGEIVSFNGTVRLYWREDDKDDDGCFPLHNVLTYGGQSVLSRASSLSNNYILKMDENTLYFEKRDGETPRNQLV